MYGIRPFGYETTPSRHRPAVLAVGSGLLFFFGLAILTPFHFFPFFPLFWVLPFLAMRALWTTSDRARTFPEDGRTVSGEERKEKELLDALERQGQITAARVALETSLSVSEADERLSRLAEKGHVRVQAREASLAYSLWDMDLDQAGRTQVLREEIEGGDAYQDHLVARADEGNTIAADAGTPPAHTGPPREV